MLLRGCNTDCNRNRYADVCLQSITFWNCERLCAPFCVLQVRPDIDDPSQTSDDAAAATDDQNITVDDPIAGKALSAMSRQGTQKKRRRSPHRLDEILAQRQTVLEKIAASVGQPASTTQQEDDIDYFGKVVAAHMREVPKDKLIPCQKAILSALEIYINKSE